jgi:hypothetical protein
MTQTRFSLKFKCVNAAFGETEEDRNEAIAIILRNIMENVKSGQISGRISDFNGNLIGSYGMEA